MDEVKTLQERAAEGRAIYGSAMNGGSDKFIMRAGVTCPVCGDHGRLFVDAKTGICDQCDREGKNPRPAKEPAKNADGQPCPSCGKIVQSAEGMMKHLIHDHSWKPTRTSDTVVDLFGEEGKRAVGSDYDAKNEEDADDYNDKAHPGKEHEWIAVKKEGDSITFKCGLNGCKETIKEKASNADGRKGTAYKGYVIEEVGGRFMVYEEDSGDEVGDAFTMAEAKAMVEHQIATPHGLKNATMTLQEKAACGREMYGSAKNVADLSPAEKIEAIKSTLSNDENSSDSELVRYFVDEIGVTEAEARKWVAKRDDYMGKI